MTFPKHKNIKASASRFWQCAVFFMVLLISSTSPSKAERGDIIPSKSKITFFGTSNIHSFEGTVPRFTGFVYGDSKDVRSINYMQLQFDILSFTTSNTARDENMRKMFGAKEEPDIVFRATNILVAHDRAFADVTGKLTIRGITKRVVFTAFLSKQANNEVRAKGNFTIKLSDFNLKPPAPAFIRVKNDVKVKFDVTTNWLN